MPGTPGRESRPRLEFLDVVRGAAALLVMSEHALHMCVPAYYQFSRSYVVVGEAAILAFFMVSGFVIPMSLEEGRSLKQFWIRRVFRLFPIYWLSIALGFVVMLTQGYGAGAAVSDVGTWVANIFLLQSALHLPHIWGAFWTLPYELMIYVVCASLYAIGALGRIGPRVVGGLIVAFIALGVAKPLLTGTAQSMDGGTIQVVTACLLGFLAHRHLAGQIDRRTLYVLTSGLAMAMGVIWAVNHALIPTMTVGRLVRFTGLWLLGAGSFFVLMERRHRPMPAVVSWLGRHSYPIYLLHPVALTVLSRYQGSPWLFFPGVVGSTLLMAAVARRLVELPGIALGRRLEKRWAPSVAAPPAVLRRAA